MKEARQAWESRYLDIWNWNEIAKYARVERKPQEHGRNLKGQGLKGFANPVDDLSSRYPFFALFDADLNGKISEQEWLDFYTNLTDEE
jgi:hypothetical protein